jgi:hypothetical protein
VKEDEGRKNGRTEELKEGRTEREGMKEGRMEE